MKNKIFKNDLKKTYICNEYPSDFKNEVIKKSFDEYMKFSNIREIHKGSEVGIVKSYRFNENGIFIEIEVADDSSFNKL